MYEFLEDGSKVLGKEMREAVFILQSETINNELKTLNINFNHLKKALHERLKKVRHNVSAHKDRDIRLQITLGDSIDHEEFHVHFVLFMIFYLCLKDFHRLLIDEIISKQATREKQSQS
jgi:hypothetical protein